MSNNDIEVYGGNDLQPYSPGGLDLYTPTAEDNWGELSPDYLSTPGQQVANLNDPAVQANINALAGAFEHDFQSWGFVQRDIDLCVQWFKQSLANPITSMPPRRNAYNLWQLNNDPTMVAFANFAATQRFSQQLMQSVCWWIKQVEDAQRGAGHFAPQQATTSADPLDQLSDADYARVVAANERAAQATMGRLKDLWGSSFAANMRLVEAHFAALTDAEQQHLNQFTAGFIRGTNTYEILVSLYAEAVQAHTIPRDGASIEMEIQKITAYMKSNRSAYMRDEATQARFRELLNLQSGGR